MKGSLFWRTYSVLLMVVLFTIAIFSGMVAAAQQQGMPKEALNEQNPRVAEIPFDSDRKLMTTVHTLPGGGFVSFTKGAAEAILERLAQHLQYTTIKFRQLIAEEHSIMRQGNLARHSFCATTT